MAWVHFLSVLVEDVPLRRRSVWPGLDALDARTRDGALAVLQVVARAIVVGAFRVHTSTGVATRLSVGLTAAQVILFPL